MSEANGIRLDREGTDEHRLNRSAQALHQKVVNLVAGVDVDEALIRDVEAMVKRHRFEARVLHGIAFPEMTVMFVAGIGYLQVVRADLDEGGLAVLLQNITGLYPQVTAGDLAAAVARAFPGYRPGNVVRR